MQTNAMALEVESLDGVSVGSSTKSRRRLSFHSQFHCFFLNLSLLTARLSSLLDFFRLSLLLLNLHYGRLT